MPSREKKVVTRQRSTVATVLMDFFEVTWRMAVPVLFGAAIGLWVDDLFASRPVGFLVCITLGLLSGLALAVRVIIKVNKESQR